MRIIKSVVIKNVSTGVSDPDPYGSALILLSWIRVRRNADPGPDPDPGARKLIKINK